MDKSQGAEQLDKIGGNEIGSGEIGSNAASSAQFRDIGGGLSICMLESS